ncbi:MAG: CBS domain-containing protein [Chloroflexi bacterium]|nr:CBS domain-containing protein [Chloroflexota bacterium]
MLTVQDMMTIVPDTISPTTTLRDIIGMMKTEGYRHLPVVDGGKLVGIITDRDIRLVMNSPMVLHERRQDEELIDAVTAESSHDPNPVSEP